MQPNKALYLVGKEKFEVSTNPLRPLANNEILLKITLSGVCGTDLSYIDFDYHTRNNAAIIGHEFVGVIADIGSEVTQVQPGDRVIAEPSVPCGTCAYCLNGNSHFCTNITFFGYPPHPGGFQEYIILPEHAVIPMPATMSDAAAILVEPLAVCLHALNLTKIKLHTDVAVIGCGAIGLLTIKALQLAGARNIFACDPVDYRREMAITMGATHVCDPSNNQFYNLVMEQTNGFGVPRVFEASGKQSGSWMTTHVAKCGAELIMIGVNLHDTHDISLLNANSKGLTIKTVRRLKNTLPAATELMLLHPELEQLVTNQFSFATAEQTILDAKYYRNGVIKAALAP